MSLIIGSGMAVAYVNYGRWVADCPTGCGGAERLEPKASAFLCTECKAICPILWPSNAQEIWDVLQERPYDKVRNWFPQDHPLALAAHCPHGQTVDQLREEARENGVDGS